jgi:Tfp pilus assembly protein PilF
MIDSLGWVHFRQNKMESAIKNLKRALELLPSDVNITEHLGDVYTKLGKIKEAQEMYNRALKLDPQNGLLQKKLEDLIKNK